MTKPSASDPLGAVEGIPLLQLGHSEYVVRMEFCLGGARLATMDAAGVLKLWDVASGRLILDLIESGVASARAEDFFTVSSDGGVLLLQSPNAGAVLYDAGTGRRLATVEDGEITAAARTAQGILAPIAAGREIHIRNLTSGTEAIRLRWPRIGHRIFGRTAISADGGLVAAVHHQARLVVWETRDGQILHDLPVQVTHGSVEPFFSRDGRRIGFYSFRDPIVVIDLETGTYSIPFGGPGSAERAWLDVRGDRLGAFLGDRVTVWDIATSEVLHESQPGEYAEEAAVGFTADPRVLSSWSDGNEVYVDALSTGTRLWAAPPPPACPFGYRLRFHPSGNLLLRNSSEMVAESHEIRQHVTVWDVAELRPVCSHAVGDDESVVFDVLPDHGGFVEVGEDRAVFRRWQDTRVTREVPVPIGCPVDIALSADGKYLLAMIGERNPIAIALAPGEPDIRFRQSILNILAIALSQMGRMDPLEDFIEMNPAAPPGMAVELLASDARGNRLFTASRAAGICLWDLRSGQCLRRRSVGRTACTSLAVSPDGRFVAAGLRNRILILDAADLREVRELCGHTGTVQAIHFSPNDPVLASGAWDSTIRIWDLETGEERHCLKGHVGPVGCVQFARGGRVLASAGNDAALRFWDVPTGLLLRTVLDLSPADYLVLSSDGRYRGTPAAVSVLSFTIRGPGECRNVTAAEYAVEVGETLNVEALRLR